MGLTYDSNEAVLHDVLNVDELAPALADSFQRSLALFQAIPCTEYNLRPHTEDGLLRIPTSIPDDEMLFDRLQITDAARLGDLWSEIMRRVYDAGGNLCTESAPQTRHPGAWRARRAVAVVKAQWCAARLGDAG